LFLVVSNIYDLITPIALAHWIMGDGSVRNDSLTLCTDNFTTQEVVQLMNVLIIKFNLDCTLHFNVDKPRIFIKKNPTSRS
jgi:transcriptional regulator NrdR family protein